MAMNSTTLATTLGATIEAKIRVAASLGATPYPELTDFSVGLGEAIAQDVIAHIKANAALYQAMFSGTFNGTINTMAGTCQIVITNQAVNGGVE